MFFFYRPFLVGTFLYQSHKHSDEGTPSTMTRARLKSTCAEKYTLSAPEEKQGSLSWRSRQPETTSLPHALMNQHPGQTVMLRGKLIPQRELDELIGNILNARQAVLECQLICNDLGDEGALALANMLRHAHHLKSFKLAFNQVSGIGVRALAESLLENDTLEVLDLSSASIDKAAARALADMLENNHGLRSLKLELCLIGERELQVLAQALAKNNTLTCLDIGLCNVTNNGLRSIISALETNYSLEEVILRGNQNLDASLLKELNRLLVRNQYLNGSSGIEPGVCTPSRLCY